MGEIYEARREVLREAAGVPRHEDRKKKAPGDVLLEDDARRWTLKPLAVLADENP